MKNLKITKLNLFNLKNTEIEFIVAGNTKLRNSSDSTDVNTTSGDSYTRDNSESSDSHSRDHIR